MLSLFAWFHYLARLALRSDDLLETSGAPTRANVIRTVVCAQKHRNTRETLCLPVSDVAEILLTGRAALLVETLFAGLADAMTCNITSPYKPFLSFRLRSLLSLTLGALENLVIKFVHANRTLYKGIQNVLQGYFPSETTALFLSGFRSFLPTTTRASVGGLYCFEIKCWRPLLH